MLQCGRMIERRQRISVGRRCSLSVSCLSSFVSLSVRDVLFYKNDFETTICNNTRRNVPTHQHSMPISVYPCCLLARSRPLPYRVLSLVAVGEEWVVIARYVRDLSRWRCLPCKDTNPFEPTRSHIKSACPFPDRTDLPTLPAENIE